jgi:hypothetical protein
MLGMGRYSSEDLRRKVDECLRQACDPTLPGEVRSHWLRVADMWSICLALAENESARRQASYQA